MQMPEDPILLMSLVNTYLRDQYQNLDALCEDRAWNKDELCQRLQTVGYAYQPVVNQFR